ncbi:MAG: insulinase family protein [Tidjanibacter sp.]|nr:insulinase family protein [Tidjanibacter sp.]
MQRPPINLTPELRVPHTTLHTCANGTRLYTMHNSKQGVIRVSFIFRAGTSWQSVPFSASATINTLSEGTERFSALEIAERLDFVGSYFDANIDRDWAVLTYCSLSKFATETFEIAEQVVLHPTFPEKEIEVYCAKRKEQLIVQRSKPDHLSRELFGKSLFGAEHPYGITSPAEAYDSLCRGDVEEFYRTHYTAENCFAVLCGDITDEHIARTMAILEQLPHGTTLERTIPAPAPQHFATLNVEGAVQSCLKIGTPLFPRTHPDFIPMQMVATAMGGYFGSRLMQNLRERHGYTYGAYSAMINLDQSGYFVMSADVASDYTEAAIEEMIHEVERFCSKPMDERELQMVKNIIFGDVMRIFDGPFGVADVTIENIQNGTDNGYTERLLHQVATAQASHLQEVASKWLIPSNLTTTIVG